MTLAFTLNVFLIRSDQKSGCYGNLYFHILTIIKVKIDNFSVSVGIFVVVFQNFY